MEIGERNYLTELPLEKKIDFSQKIIAKALLKYQPNEIYLAWSGGKNSTVMAWIVREVCIKNRWKIPKVLFIDEGYVLPEIIELGERLKEKWQLEIIKIRNEDIISRSYRIGDPIRVRILNLKNQMEIQRLGFKKDSFHLEPESYVCRHLLKTVPMHDFLKNEQVKAIYIGIRWDEHEAGSEKRFFSPRSKPQHTRIYPILHFKEQEIWKLINVNNIPFCSPQLQGFRSLGTKCSTKENSNVSAGAQNLDTAREKEKRKREKKEIIARLRSLGYM